MLINVDKIILAASNSGGRGQLEYFPDRAGSLVPVPVTSVSCYFEFLQASTVSSARHIVDEVSPSSDCRQSVDVAVL